MDLFDYAQKERDIGMQRAEKHAEETVTPDWATLAYSFLVTFARRNQHFISEDVSGLSKEQGFPQPPTDRAWGQTYRRAVKAGIIVQDGTGRSLRRHASLCPRWRSRIYEGA